MNKKYLYIRTTIAAVVGVLPFWHLWDCFYPLQIFDVQLTALLQRVLVDFPLFALVFYWRVCCC